jgi:4-amino-4-deoxy-L-arabinose transferase-like glycosyltransferase
MGRIAVALFALAFVIHAPRLPGELLGYWGAGTAAVALIAALAGWIPALRELPERCGRLLERPSPLVFAVIIGVTTATLSLFFAWWLFALRPVNADEFAQLWHARMIAAGHLSLPPDPNPEFFAIDNVVDTGRWYSEYPIGGPAVLALGVLIGAPWLINPILSGLTAVALYQFARRAFGETQGRAVSALFSVTPMALMMGGSQMNHTAVLLLMTVVLAALAEWERTEHDKKAMALAALMGAALGAMAIIRPLDAVVASLMVGAYQAWIGMRQRTRWRHIAVQGLAGATAIVPLLIANHGTTGSALRFGYNVMWGAAHQIGFHIDPTGVAHTPARALQYAVAYVSDLNAFVNMWPVPVLLVASVTLLALPRLGRWDLLLLALFWAQVLAYAIYWHYGRFLGPRFLFTALPTIIVLAARAPFVINRPAGKRFAFFAVLGCIVTAWAFHELPYGVLGTGKDIRRSRRSVRADVAAAVQDAGLHRAVVFVREPFSYRLIHRLWGVGVSRSEAASLLVRSDACSLLSALRAAEADSVTPRERKAALIRRAAASYAPGRASVRIADPQIQISSMASVTPACREEVESDVKHGVALYGPALLLNSLDAEGRIGGDVVFVSDLGERNELLRSRFGDRTWYRLSVIRPGDDSFRPVLAPY